MLDSEDTGNTGTTGNTENSTPADAAAEQAPAEQAPAKAPRKRAAAKKTTKKAAAARETAEPAPDDAAAPAPRKRARKSAAAPETAEQAPAENPAEPAGAAPAPRKRTRKAAAAAPAAAEPPAGTAPAEGGDDAAGAPRLAAPGVLFQPPEPTAPRTRKRAPRTTTAEASETTEAAEGAAAPAGTGEAAAAGTEPTAEVAAALVAEPDDIREIAVEEATGARRRRRRGRRGRGSKSGGEAEAPESAAEAGEPGAAEGDSLTADGAEETADEAGGGTTARRRRRRRRADGGDGESGPSDDPPNTVVHVREAAKKEDTGDGVRGVKGSTRLEAKRQRRRDGRESSRRRPPILTESEFLARREAVDRVMAVRDRDGRTQIAVLEDDVLVEHYVTRASSTSYVGNIYLGRVQNVLPSMEAAFVDIGKGRNGVLYAGEVNWDAAGLEGKARAIENALNSGDTVLVQVTKDPIGHKGARLTSQISLPGRFLVYVPGGGMTGISRKLPDTERHRLKSILKKIVPEDAGVIIRTAAEGASEDELTRDVERLKAQWETISKKAKNTKSAPTLVHGEPDLAIRVVRDVFNEDFKKLVVQGDGAWSTISEYLGAVAPDLAERVSKHVGDKDVFTALRVDEQLAKALDRKVWLPSGGSLVIDRTEAMTVIDVNTGKFVGAGGNLEETVTRNNLEAAEEIVRQLRLRDVGGIVVIDFIDMVLESNRDLVLRRLTECLGRDRTKHQVAEVTSLGLVQMTRKRVGEGLLEAFSDQCEHCKGRGVIIHAEPVERATDRSDRSERAEGGDEERGRGRRKRGAKKAEPADEQAAEDPQLREKRIAAIAAIHRAAHPDESPEAAQAAAEIAAAEAAGELEMEAVAAVIEGESMDVELLDAGTVGEPIGTPRVTEAEAEVRPDVEPEAAAEPPATVAATAPRPRRRRVASRPAGPPAPAATAGSDGGSDGGSEVHEGVLPHQERVP